jgi:hypothetical protein
MNIGTFSTFRPSLLSVVLFDFDARKVPTATTGRKLES